ncbi:MAG: hypothetical protein IJ833_01695 [Lachnospiraceae bacterium]|nr:hypothetical protein [Lachnospiraceae bacterium]
MEHKPISKKVTYIYFSFVGVLFVFCCLTGRELARKGNLQWTTTYTVGTLLLSLAAGIVLGTVICKAVWLLTERQSGNLMSERDSKTQSRKGWIYRSSQGAFYACSLFLITLAWLPSYLAYYPAICAYDFPVQLAQISLHEYVDHHPIAHTLLIRLFMKLGERVLGSVNDGIACFAALQLLFLAAVLAYGMLLLKRFRVRTVWIVGMQLLSMLYPFHWYMSISITKDTIFTGFFLLQIFALLVLLLEERRESGWKRTDVLLFLSSVGMILFRNNGKYAMMVLLVIELLALWKGKSTRGLMGRLFIVSIAAFLMGNVLLAGLFRVTDARQGDRREMLSVPIQQLARCMLYHGGVGILPEDDGTMREEDADMIRRFLADESYRFYQADFADPVKRHVNTSAALGEAGGFIKTYLHLFAQYPGDYVNAVLLLDAGYLYPEDESHAYVNQVDYAPGKGYAQTRWAENEIAQYGFHKASKWEWLHERLEQWAEDNGHLKLPIVKYMLVPGTFLWAYLLLAGVFMIKRVRMCLPLSLVLGYYITMLLGPVVQLRYIYPVMVMMPFLALLGIADRDETDSNKGREHEEI